MAKRFAAACSEGVQVRNLQMAFWKLAINHFEELRTSWRLRAPADGNTCGEYNLEEFVQDAAVALVLAGTSVSILLGQNVSADKNGRVPQPRQAAEELFGNLKSTWVNFFDRYDSLRHFGEPKWKKIEEIDEVVVGDDFAVAEEIWRAVLNHRGEDTPSIFAGNYSFC